jgi:integrase/recombinase XerC
MTLIVPMRQNLNTFLEHLTSQGFSKHTILAYRRDVTTLFNVAGYDTSLTTAVLRQAIMTLMKDHKPRSVARMIAAWRHFFAYLVERKVMTENPALALKTPKKPQLLPKALLPDDVTALLERKPENELEVRDLAMWELLYSSGLRLSELASLLYADYRGDWVRVLGKGNKMRDVPVGRKAKVAITQWLVIRAQWAQPTSVTLFISRQGKALTGRAIEYRLQKWGKKSNASLAVHPHMLRHSMASHLLQSSKDIRAVQEMLGHCSLASTQIYTRLDFQHLLAVHEQCHPRSKKKGRDNAAQDEDE